MNGTQAVMERPLGPASRVCAWPAATPAIDAEVRELCSGIQLLTPPWVSEAHADARAFAQLIISQARPGNCVLDVGTGSGLAAICLARSGYEVEATDLSRAAVRCAVGNAARYGIQLTCYESDLLDAVTGRFDLIAFNPPYNFAPDTWAANLAKNLLRRVPWVRQSSGTRMPASVRRFHRRLIDRFLRQVPDHLKDGGAVLLHAFEAELDDFAEVMPAGADLRLLRHPDLTANATAGLLIRLSPECES